MTRRILVMAAFALATCAWADPIPLGGEYRLRQCGAGFAPCDVAFSYRAPSAAELAGLDQALFFSFMQPILNGWTTGSFNWTVRDSNSNGYVIGRVEGPNNIHTQFVFRAGQLYCCYTDAPFSLWDINDNNVIAGFSNGAFGANGPYVDGAFGFPLQLSAADRTILSNPFLVAEAIDNQNRILIGNGAGVGRYILEPVPEPASILLLGAVLIGVRRLMARS